MMALDQNFYPNRKRRCGRCYEWPTHLPVTPPPPDVTCCFHGESLYLHKASSHLCLSAIGMCWAWVRRMPQQQPSSVQGQELQDKYPHTFIHLGEGTILRCALCRHQWVPSRTETLLPTAVTSSLAYPLLVFLSLLSHFATLSVLLVIASQIKDLYTKSCLRD